MIKKIETSIEKIKSLLENYSNNERSKKAFAVQYPNSPEYFINIAMFHSAAKGVDACVKWLESFEDFLRNPKEGFDYGSTYVMMSHLYNLFLIRELLEKGSPELVESLDNLKFFLKEKNWNGIEMSIDALENTLGRFRLMPEFYTDNNNKLDRNMDNVTIEMIQKKVVEYFGLEIKDLTGKKRTKNIDQAKRIAMYLSRELTDRSLPEIGEAFERTYVTVINAVNRIRKDISIDKKVNSSVSIIKKQLRRNE